MPGAFQISVEACLLSMQTLAAHGFEQPQLGQGRQAILVGEACVVGELTTALGQILAAILLGNAHDLQGGASGCAEATGGEHVATAQRQVVVVLDCVDLDAGAAVEEKRREDEQPGT